MEKLIICGKADFTKDEKILLANKDAKVWMLGTDHRKGADMYFELHGIFIEYHDNVIYNLPESVYQQGLPINNSISALLVHAYLLGYKDISVIGAPMDGKGEYMAQRPSMAFIMGFLAGKGVKVYWPYMPRNVDYGKTRR